LKETQTHAQLELIPGPVCVLVCQNKNNSWTWDQSISGLRHMQPACEETGSAGMGRALCVDPEAAREELWQEEDRRVLEF